MQWCVCQWWNEREREMPRSYIYIHIYNNMSATHDGHVRDLISRSVHAPPAWLSPATRVLQKLMRAQDLGLGGAEKQIDAWNLIICIYLRMRSHRCCADFTSCLHFHWCKRRGVETLFCHIASLSLILLRWFIRSDILIFSNYACLNAIAKRKKKKKNIRFVCGFYFVFVIHIILY